VPARLENSRDSPQVSTESRSTSDLTHARMLQLQELGLAATVSNTLDLMPEELSSLMKTQIWTLDELPSKSNTLWLGIQCKEE